MSWPDISQIEGLTDHQQEELATATSAPVGILTGGPGTGKTHILAALGKHLHNAAYVAPTGRAASRLELGMKERGIHIPCATIHRLLGPNRNGHDGDGWSFIYSARQPLPVNYLICDESSMNDSSIMRCMLDACGPRTHVLLVGDPNQLPPVGKGSPFLDMINSEMIPHGQLNETHRFSGRVATVCQQINLGQAWEASPTLDIEAEYPENFIHCETASSVQSTAMLERLIERFGNRTDNVARDVQVLVPLNSKSSLSRKDLNVRLQRILNGKQSDTDIAGFRIQDKVMCTKNSRRKVFVEGKVEKEDLFIANGDMGFVTHLDKKGMAVAFEGQESAVFIGRGEWGDIELGYAVTCHKGQGSQWPFVIAMCDDSNAARRVCNRSWWYTAISRTQQICVTVGRKHLIDRDCAKVDVQRRRTLLKEKLKERIPRWEVV